MAEPIKETPTSDLEPQYSTPANDPKNMQEVTQYGYCTRDTSGACVLPTQRMPACSLGNKRYGVSSNSHIILQVQSLLQNMQDKFQSMSDQIINRIDEMGTRVDELEKNITDIMTPAGVENEK